MSGWPVNPLLLKPGEDSKDNLTLSARSACQEVPSANCSNCANRAIH